MEKADENQIGINFILLSDTTPATIERPSMSILDIVLHVGMLNWYSSNV